MKARIEIIRQSRNLQIFVGAGAVGIVIVLVGLVKFFQIRAAIAQHEQMVMPPEAVSTSLVSKVSWQNRSHAVGSITASQGATLSAEVAGKIAKINFESGADVKAGDFLLEIDASVEDAQLVGAVASTKRARTAFERAERLRKDLAVSQESFEAAQEALARAEAEEKALRATIAKKRILAPFGGKLGIRQVSLGQYVSPGTPLVPLYALDPVYADFALPQNALSQLSLGLKVSVTVDAFPDRVFEGVVTGIDPQIENATRTVAVRATLANQSGELRPGMFTHIEIDIGTPQDALIIPQTAIMHAPYGDSVWVVQSSDAQGPRDISQTIVRLGQRRGDKVMVLSGLLENQEVVTAGAFKLRPGAKVVVDNSRSPVVSDAPTPADT